MLRMMLSLQRATHPAGRLACSGACVPSRQAPALPIAISGPGCHEAVMRMQGVLPRAGRSISSSWADQACSRLGLHGARAMTSCSCSSPGQGDAELDQASTSSSAVTPVVVQAAPSVPPSDIRRFSSHIKMNSDLLSKLRQDPEEYAAGSAVLDSIIKIYTVHSRPNHFLPWQNHPKRESTGTGFVVHDRLILTNAHVVADSTYVLVKRHGSGTKFKAEVQAVGHDCDLAILSVDVDAFWTLPTAMVPLKLGELPALQQDVVVVGYPTGGDNTSVTSGVVSRVEVAQYVHAATHLMAIQIDAAINPGNSGGPAMQDDEVVGVAFQNLPHAENIGYIIPTPVVLHFLSEVAKYGYYQGYCSLGIMCQNLENPHLRRALGMQTGQTGVLINTVHPTSTAAKVIQPGDVLLEFGGVPIANDGTVHLRHRERIYFNYLITLQPTGAVSGVKLLRDGVEREHKVELHPTDMLVPVHTYDRLPSYFIYAGLVFAPLSQPYLHEYGDDWTNTSPRRLYDKAMHKMMQQPGQQIVVLTQVLSDDVNTGYQLFQNLQVLRVNGEELLNLVHLRELVDRSSDDGFVRFELEDDRLMVVDRALAAEASERIAERYRIPALMSADFTALRHNPLDAINALVRSCLLEERSSDAEFTYTPKTGSAQALKWTFHNGLGLVFVAVYQKSLSLLYVEELLTLIKNEFVSQYQPGSGADYSAFKEPFDRVLRECEARADKVKKGALLSKRPPSSTAATPAPAGRVTAMPSAPSTGGRDDGDEDDSDDAGGSSPAPMGTDGSDAAAGHSDDASGGAGAFNVSKLKGALPRGARARANPKKKDKDKDGTHASAPEPRKKEKRNWDVLGGSRRTRGAATAEELDRSDMPDDLDADGGGGARAAGAGSVAGGEQSRMDADDDVVDDIDEEVLERSAADAAKQGQAGAGGGGVLGSFLGRLALRVAGSSSLSADDLAPALDDMKKRLMERNVAEEIAAAVCASVGETLQGRKLASFTGVGAMVRRACEEALSGILYKRQVDVLLDIRKAQERGKPYVIVFCGVNGVGKSTNLAKIAYWLGQHDIKVTIAACDTFRAGAVEQLKTHCARLQVPLYERGYEKDPAKVAFEAVKQAERDGRDVVLVDTAGRMQDNEPLMRALSNLIAVNDPQLVLFVGEALVGNDAVDQLTKFSRALQDLSPASGPGSGRRRGIDGIVLTKFDTIDDKVGAAVSMVYSSGAPVMFVGCGQTYVDLKKLNVKSVVNSLLK